MNRRTATIITAVGAGLALVAGIGIAVAATSGPEGRTDPDATGTTSDATPTPAPDGKADDADDPALDAESNDDDSDDAAYDTDSTLRFLIEEEKLAHDVYVTLAEQWGSRVFENIAASETTHQDLVAPLLEARTLDDPRSSEVGVFTDPGLQSLYDELIARGTQSLDEAIQVGIVIEEKDIADLGAAIAAEDEADVVSVLERLLAGSENHLRSFERLA